jgi:secreted trypsin-like serine protease
LRPALLGALAAACLAAAPAGAVVHGSPVDPAAVPWFASVGSCGGTLVAPDRVLTAAHCVGGRTPDMLGGVAVGGVARSPTHIAMHPGGRHRNGPENFLDDVAVVELDQPVTGVPISDRACALAFRGYKGETSERFDPRMRCAIDADGLPPLYSGCHGDSGGPLWSGTPGRPCSSAS